MTANIAQLLLNYHMRMGFEEPCAPFIQLFNENVRNNIEFNVDSYRHKLYVETSCYYRLLPIKVSIRLKENNENAVFVQYIKINQMNMADYALEQRYVKEKPPRQIHEEPSCMIWTNDIAASTSTAQLIQNIRNDIYSIMDQQ